MKLQPPSNNFRSEEVNEIFDSKPSWLLKWGITAILVAISSVLVLSSIIKYPDLLSAEVLITTSPNPLKLLSRLSGKIIVLKSDKETCAKGELIAYIESNAEPLAVLALEERIRNNDAVTGTPEIGDLQSFLSAFKEAQSEGLIFSQNDALGKQIVSLESQLHVLQDLGSTLKEQHTLMLRELRLASEKFAIDSVLFAQKVNSTTDFNTAKGNWIAQQRTVLDLKATLLNNRIQIHRTELEIESLRVKKAEQQQRLSLLAENAREELLAQIVKWKESHLFVAGSDGKVAHLDFIDNGMFVQADRPLFCILPLGGEFTARAMLPGSGSGKVKIGQDVNIRLTDYPYEQFGMLTGSVRSISEISSDGKYYVLIDLPNGLITTQNRNVGIRNQLTGVSEIVTEDLTLFSRIFYQITRSLKRSA